jgi:hypothetical protein
MTGETSDSSQFGFEELRGHVHESQGRVMRAQIFDDVENLILEAEGELTIRETNPGKLSFQLGGTTPPDRADIQFFAASWAVIHLEPRRFGKAWWMGTESSIGPDVLQILLTDGSRITLWAAMPPKHQWTDAHDAVR